MKTLFDERPMPVESGMQWQAVDSSQISEIGYDSGAEYPLGLKFPPTKKQQKAGEPGSEYHYANVTPELHAEFLAAKTNPDYDNSIGVFFGKVIKSRPDLYPFVKVEAENPPLPPSSPNGGGSTSTKNSTTSGKTSTKTTEETTDTPSGSTLAVIDTLTPDALFAPGGVTDAQLAAGREWYLTEAKKYGIETEDRRTELKRFARPLQKLRTGIEARAKEFTGETKRKLAAIDTEKRRLVLVVGGIEDDVLRPLTEWEAEEAARKVRLAGYVTRLAEAGQPHLYQTVPELESAIRQLEQFCTSDMQEYKASAESAIAASLRVLKPELARRVQAEKDAAELAELRRKQAEREEADRKAEAQRQEDARIAEAAEKLAAKQVADAVEAARVETRQEVIAELSIPTRPDWMLLDDAEPEPDPEEEPHPALLPYLPPSPVLPVLSKLPDPAVRYGGGHFDSRPAEPEAQTREDAVNWAVVEALMGCSLTKHEALTVVDAIVKGRIPHVAITY